ncbi:MAG: aminotransferase class I/II-fold pyridoxal phosphate-dependent enzyme [Wenzhouxiangellaceae bacterium]|nr:aminotransferase class I/II-fold pyridoxal phosphate-dependent enzyme [Wenzhouxiangellaceae bacterium]
MPNRNENPKTATLCVHAGHVRGRPEFGLNTPIVTSTAFDYTRDDQVRYPRYLNTPNHRVVADRIAALEGAEAAFVTASGMGAISAVFLGLMKPGEHAILLDGLYGGTTDLVEGLLKPYGFEFSVWDGNPDTLAGLIRDDTRLAWVETPTNPLLRVVDLAGAATVLRERGVVAVADNTFATPVLQRPIEHGFDLVMHSGTKYFTGHSDLLSGALAGSGELIDRIRPHAIRLGSALNGQDLYLLERSLKTLELRVTRQTGNAVRLARRLAEHEHVAEVFYPGLEDDAGHATASGQMSGFGAMLSFRLGPRVAVETFLGTLKLITPAVSLAGVESTICQPSRTSHAKLTGNARAALGIDDHLMRLSVGIEHADDLVADLDAALADAVGEADWTHA